MRIKENIVFLNIIQGLLLGSLGQQLLFHFPQEIKALKGSCVEIPCTFNYTPNSGHPSVIWYLYDNPYSSEIFNSKYTLSVSKEFRGRTSLVSNARNSCSLRIDRVTREDWRYYYPGISPEINSYIKQSKTILLDVKDSSDIPKLTLLGDVIEGNSITVSCSANHTCQSSPPDITWNKDSKLIDVHHKDLGDGEWRVVSVLTYHLSYLDQGKQLRCTVKYPNGQIYNQAVTLNITSGSQYSRKHLYFLVPVIICFVLVLPIIYYFWRKRKSQSESSVKENENFQTNDGNYTDLLRCEISAGYEQLKPGTNPHANRNRETLEYENIQSQM
ncbi:myelin-associated glycoprotein-like [Bombina bombina]|uniref:myelin-associated glycoprotein-like n=1 Tax=Bombina bombina TaxID=8345 RepID=UPI00235B0ECA|nr:myelin-associated glycoprotein-like [Bombina bombina]